MTFTLDIVIDALGVALGILFVFLYRRASHTFAGSVFKVYHRWMTVGAGLFMLAFIADYASLISGGILWLDLTHSGLLLVSVFVFVATNLYLPQEAIRYLSLEAEEKVTHP